MRSRIYQAEIERIEVPAVSHLCSSVRVRRTRSCTCLHPFGNVSRSFVPKLVPKSDRMGCRFYRLECRPPTETESLRHCEAAARTGVDDGSSACFATQPQSASASTAGRRRVGRTCPAGFDRGELMLIAHQHRLGAARSRGGEQLPQIVGAHRCCLRVSRRTPTTLAEVRMAYATLTFGGGNVPDRLTNTGGRYSTSVTSAASPMGHGWNGAHAD